MSNSKLTEVLDYLAKQEFDSEEQYEITLAKFREVDFEDSKYSTIFDFLVKSQAEQKGFSILNENLRNFKKDKEQELSQNEVLKRNVDKTYDYLQLEYQRYKDLNNLRDDLKNIQKIAEEEKSNVDKIRIEIDSVNSEAKQIQTQYITILGIFASIVMAFVGGLTFSTSVLSHMHEVSIYRLVFVICCIGFLIFNSLFALFGFILRIAEKQADYCVFRVVNGIFVAIIIINALHYTYWGKDKKETPKQEVNLSIQAKTK